jgi:hypothetical protein
MAVFGPDGAATKHYRTYNGHRWSAALPFPSTPSRGVALSCASSSFCGSIARAVVGDTIDSRFVAWTWDGRTWKRGGQFAAHVDHNNALIMFGCTEVAQRSWRAVDWRGKYLRFTDGQWSRQLQLVSPKARPDAGLTTGSCSATNDCLIASAGLWARFDFRDGRWTLHRDKVPVGDAGLSCVGPTKCVGLDFEDVKGTAVGKFATFQLKNGWSTTARIAAGDSFLESSYDVSCATADDCLAVEAEYGTQPIWSYHGGGWHPTRVPEMDLTSVSCVSSLCVVGNDHGQVVTRRDRLWSQPLQLA